MPTPFLCACGRAYAIDCTTTITPAPPPMPPVVPPAPVIPAGVGPRSRLPAPPAPRIVPPPPPAPPPPPVPRTDPNSLPETVRPETISDSLSARVRGPMDATGGYPLVAQVTLSRAQGTDRWYLGLADDWVVWFDQADQQWCFQDAVASHRTTGCGGLEFPWGPFTVCVV